MKKRWKVNQADRGLQEALGAKLNILPVTAQLLINRGLVDCDKAFSFLTPDLKDLHDPFLMAGMERAAARISEAIRGAQKIAVYGDYDVDGTTSTALLNLFFKELGVDTVCYIPDRHKEGYGLNCEAVRKLAAQGVRLIITVDCGSSNHEEIALANALGMDVIVTDHHELPSGPPPAYCVINPKQRGCNFPFKGLAGVGVAFNLAMAVRALLRKEGWFTRAEPNLKKYLDLVAIGTVADMVPLLDENRVLVSYGLKELDSTRRPGLIALKEAAGIKPGKVDSDNIAYNIAPRINAAGRVASAGTALRLLTTDDAAAARALAAALDRENLSRQKLEEEILKEAVEMYGAHASGRGIVLSRDGWHSGVIGIVASRLAERFSRPVVLIAVDGNVGKGSARGIKSYNILEGIINCADLLERYGGHKAAAGLTLHRDNIEEFKEAFLRHVNGTLSDDDLVPEITLDAQVSLAEVDLRMVAEIGSLAPFGVANREPLLCCTDAHIIGTEVVKSRHLRFKLKHNECARSGIGFGLAGLHPMEGGGYSIAFSPYLDEWKGVKNMGLRIKDCRQGT